LKPRGAQENEKKEKKGKKKEIRASTEEMKNMARLSGKGHNGPTNIKWTPP
jgi:hypothetical protein